MSRDKGTWDLRDVEDRATLPTQWGLVGTQLYKGLPESHKTLPAGAYSVTLDRNDNAPIFKRRDIKTDEIIRFKNSLSSKITSEIDRFWTFKDRFKKMGVLHRRGYLLYGPQGTGKSSIIQQIMADIIKNDGLVFICDNPKFFNRALTTLRQTEPDRPLVCIFEDIDAIIKRYGEDDLLAILDGTNMVDYVLNIATTNYPETLDRRIVSRPRRFDRVLKVENPSKSVRTAYLKKKLPKSENLKEWISKTEKLSFAGLTEAVISVVCLGNTLDDTIKILTNLEEGHPSSEDFARPGKGVGFSSDGPGSSDDDFFPISSDDDF